MPSEGSNVIFGWVIVTYTLPVRHGAGVLIVTINHVNDMLNLIMGQLVLEENFMIS